MRVVIVDDSAFMRRAISRMLDADPHIEVVGTASNGAEGVELIERLSPDVATLDVEMPKMDGLTALRQLPRNCPTRVLMLSSLTAEGSRTALKALRNGAVDVLAKDTSQGALSITRIQEELLSRVRALGEASRPDAKRHLAQRPPSAVPTFRPGQFDAICIGSSTGGPPVLENLLSSLPQTLKLPVVVAQHMPVLFTKSLAERLDEMCPLRVVHAEDGMPLERNTVYIAPGGQHTHIRKLGLGRWQLTVSDEPTDALYRPSVDALFASAAEALGARTLAVVLTGMGEDGAKGAASLHERGGTILAQDEASSVVYGMPKAVTERGLTTATLPPAHLLKSLRSLAERRSDCPSPV